MSTDQFTHTTTQHHEIVRKLREDHGMAKNTQNRNRATEELVQREDSKDEVEESEAKEAAEEIDEREYEKSVDLQDESSEEGIVEV
ncbi:hypothetical protein ACA910_010921 [Epithemia clementina (nom. ined.)]